MSQGKRHLSRFSILVFQAMFRFDLLFIWNMFLPAKSIDWFLYDGEHW